MVIESSYEDLHIEGIRGATSCEWDFLVKVNIWHFKLKALSDVVRTDHIVDIFVNELVVDSH